MVTEVVFFFFSFFPPVTELKEEIILLTSESCFLSLASHMNYFYVSLSGNEVDQLVWVLVPFFFLFMYFIPALCHERKF